MAAPIFQRTVVDTQGNIVAGAVVEVRNEATDELAPIFVDRPLTDVKANPFTTDSTGFIRFFAAAGDYRIKATFGAEEVIFRFVQLIDTDELADLDTAQTLTNKTLIQPSIAEIHNTGVLTVPTSTDTLVGRETTDTLTNKTLVEPIITGLVLDNPQYTGTLTGGTGVVNLGSGQLFKSADGDVGFGTTTPNAKLDITGSGELLRLGEKYLVIRLDGTLDFTEQLRIRLQMGGNRRDAAMRITYAGGWPASNAAVRKGSMDIIASWGTSSIDGSLIYLNVVDIGYRQVFKQQDFEILPVGADNQVDIIIRNPSAAGLHVFGVKLELLESSAPLTLVNSFVEVKTTYGGMDTSHEVVARGSGSFSVITDDVERMKVNANGSRSSVIVDGTTLLPEFVTRAWVNFNGTGTVAIRASGNVSSITDNGAGDYTVNFTTAMPDANYAVGGTTFRIAGNRNSISPVPYNRTTTSLSVYTSTTSAAAADPDFVDIQIFR